MPNDSHSQNVPITTSLFKPSALIALANLLSRGLAFAGDTVKSHYFGAGGVIDAFNVAVAVPTLLSDLLITSLMNSAIIPIFSASQSQQEVLSHLSSALLNLTTLFYLTVVFLIEAIAPQLVSLISGGSSPEVQALTVSLLHQTVLILLLLNFSSILSALLYSRRRIVLPTIAGAVFNGVILIAAITFQAQLGIFALALGLILGALLQVAVQLFGLRGELWRYRLVFWHPALRRIAVLFLPIMLGLLVEIFISRPVTYAFASQTGEGGISWMNYALTLRQLPEGLIATALSVTVLVRLSAATDTDVFRATLVQGLRLALIFILPATVGLFLLAHPITALLFEHGKFTAFDTQITAQALRWYLWGLPFSTIDLLLVVAFYARRNTLTPALIGLFCTVVYIILIDLLLPRFGLNSIMMADSLKFALHALISAVLLIPALGGLTASGLLRTLRDTLIAASVMGLVVALVNGRMMPGETLITKFMAVLIPILAGVVVYASIVILLNSRDFRLLLARSGDHR